MGSRDRRLRLGGPASNPLSRKRCLVLVFALAVLAGCSRSDNRVVVYCALDREFADEILADFTQETGIEVVKRYDTEANKSIGLYEDLVREAGRPRCDVHWNNEILATIRLQRRGIYAPYESPAAAPFPARYKADDHTWTGFAARARVIIVNVDRALADEHPRSLDDLTESRWQGRVAMAKPLFGTTASHAACLFEAWGPGTAKAFFEKLKANGVHIVAGNKQVAVGVGAGQFDVGLTDYDDAIAEVDQRRPVTIIHPDGASKASRGRGTLFIPNTVALIKNGPNPEGGKKLIDYLLSPAVEAKLARSSSRQVPLNPNVQDDVPPYIAVARQATKLEVDFAKAADAWEESQRFLKDLFALR
jgi:iron(III) transport system substrate-binding protein